MLMREIPFRGRTLPKDTIDIGVKTGWYWSAPIDLPKPVWVNHQLCDVINVSRYGAIRFSQAKDGRYHYLTGDDSLPEGLDKTKAGYMIIPWGDALKVRGCGVHMVMYEANDTIVIDYNVKNEHDYSNKYMFRVEIPVKEKNAVRIYYYHCMTGFNTYLGVVLEPDNFIGPNLKENQPYMKKAIEFTVTEDEAVQPHPEPVPTPPEPSPEPVDPQPTPNPSPIEKWVTVYQGGSYRVQERRQ